MDAADNLIVVGTSSGRLEFWEASTGNLKVIIRRGGEELDNLVILSLVIQYKYTLAK